MRGVNSVTIGSCEWRVRPQIPAIPRTQLVRTRTYPAQGPDDYLGLHGEREGVEGAASLAAPVGATVIDAEYLVEHVHGDDGSLMSGLHCLLLGRSPLGVFAGCCEKSNASWVRGAKGNVGAAGPLLCVCICVYTIYRAWCGWVRSSVFTQLWITERNDNLCTQCLCVCTLAFQIHFPLCAHTTRQFTALARVSINA